MSIILAKKYGNIFGQILRNSRKCVKTWMIENSNWSQKRLSFLPNSLCKAFLKFFFQVNPIPIRKNSHWASVHCAFSLLKRKTSMFFGLFSFECRFLTPLLCNISSKYPHNFFFTHYQHYDKWWFEQKNHHIFGKSILVLSYLKSLHWWYQPTGGNRQSVCSFVGEGRKYSCTIHFAHFPPPDRSFPTVAFWVVGSVGRPPTVCDMRCHAIVTWCRK